MDAEDLTDLADRTVAGFLDDLAARRAAPAAGSAAAMTVALAAALLGKTARLSRRHIDDAETLAARADAMRAQALELAQTDARVVAAMAARVRPASTDTAADPVDVPSVDEAIAVPRDIGELAVKVADLAEHLREHGNPRLHADAVTAGRLARAARQSTDAIVRSNETLEG